VEPTEPLDIGIVRNPATIIQRNYLKDRQVFNVEILPAWAFNCWPPPSVTTLGRNRDLENPVALMREQLVGILDLIEPEAMRDERAKINVP
jgi:hypothetical protein